MIAKLTGRIDSKGEDTVVIDVGGVGYLIFCSARTRDALPAAGEGASVHVETHVREDHIHLYGFESPAEREWFRLLTTVQGVGARVALAILSVLSNDKLSDALISGDKQMLTQAPGVGPKLAGRIASELKDRVIAVDGPLAGLAADAPGEHAPVLDDAVSALVNLGYRRGDAYGAVSQAARELGPAVAVEVLIKAGLKELSA